MSPSTRRSWAILRKFSRSARRFTLTETFLRAAGPAAAVDRQVGKASIDSRRRSVDHAEGDRLCDGGRDERMVRERQRMAIPIRAGVRAVLRRSARDRIAILHG